MWYNIAISRGDIMSKKKYVDIENDNMISTLDMYIGNILTITNGKSEISDMKHIVIRHQPNRRAKPKFINALSSKEIVVGGEVSMKTNSEILINSKCLAEVIGEQELLSMELLDVLTDINGKEKVKKYILNSKRK